MLQPGLDELSKRTGVPFAGVLPWLPNVWLDAEDTFEVAAWRRQGAAEGALRVAVVRLPRLSNGTDVEALAAEPGVDVLVTTDARALAGADLCRAARFSFHCQRPGLVAPNRAGAGDRRPSTTWCAGSRHLRRIPDAGAGDRRPDRVRSRGRSGTRPAANEDQLRPDKVLRRPTGTWHGHQVEAYEIHHGIAEIEGEAEPFLDGWRRGQVWGTMWHGAWENDGFRRAWLADIAAAAGSSWRPDPEAPGFG